MILGKDNLALLCLHVALGKIGEMCSLHKTIKVQNYDGCPTEVYLNVVHAL